MWVSYTMASARLLLADPFNQHNEETAALSDRGCDPHGPSGCVDQASKGQGLGGALLADVLDPTACSEIAAFALIVDVKDMVAGVFYRYQASLLCPTHRRSYFCR